MMDYLNYILLVVVVNICVWLNCLIVIVLVLVLWMIVVVVGQVVMLLLVIEVNVSWFDILLFDVLVVFSVVQVVLGKVGLFGVNFFEVIVGVFGIFVCDWQNYVQDEQILICGFGLCIIFGVCSICVFMDGILVMLLDGQGQVLVFNFDLVECIEVLCGLFLVFYGNVVGGVIQFYSVDGILMLQIMLGVYGGSYDSFCFLVNICGMVGVVDYNIVVLEFFFGGYCVYSCVWCELDNVKFGIDLGQQCKFIVVFNCVYQFGMQDLFGLICVQMVQDLCQVIVVVVQYDICKSVEQNQFGLIYEQMFNFSDQWCVMVYYG